HNVQDYINTYAINQEFATRLCYSERVMNFITRADIICHYASATSNANSAAIMFDPSHRRLSHNKNMHIQMLYDSGVLVPIIVNMLTEQYNRYIHNKDVYNSLNYQFHDYVNSLSQTTELLNNLNNNNKYLVTYLLNNEKLHCLFFATHAVLSTFNYYLEILLMDST
ncbi:655_t:CDS:2, partial [Scutellospora calospora]